MAGRRLDGVHVGDAEQFTFAGANGDAVHAFVVKPVYFNPAQKRPVAFLIHGGQDFRVVDTGGFASFTALQRKGIPSKFLYFPDENHWVLEPANSVLWHDTALDWIDRWTKQDAAQ